MWRWVFRQLTRRFKSSISLDNCWWINQPRSYPYAGHWEIWRPKLGMNIKFLPNNKFLFKFFHINDYNRVWKGSPWNFNSKLLILAPRLLTKDPEKITLNTVPFWVQVFGVPIGFTSSHVCEAVGNFIGRVMEIDENNFKLTKPMYLRIRVLVDITKPLKRRMRLRINAESLVMLQISY